MGTVDASAALLRSLSAAASKPVTEVVAAIERGSSPPVVAVTTQELADLLNQMALDSELEKGFAPVLQRLGFTMETQTLEKLTRTWTVTVAKRPENVFYVVCIPKSILEQDGIANLSAISLLGYVFDRKSHLYIISRDLPAMDLVLEGMIRDWAKIYEIKAIFIPWSHVTKFLGEGSEQKKIQLVRTMLELGELPTTTPLAAGAASRLTPGEEQQVHKIITQQAGNPLLDKPQDYFNDLVLSADLPQRSTFAGKWKGDTEVDANLLIKAAWMFYPNNHPRAGQNMLGWVLKAVLGKQPLSPDESKILVKIILNHHLISDPETLQTLRVIDSATETGAPSV